MASLLQDVGERVPGVALAASITQRIFAIPRRIDGILRGIESLERLAELDDTLRVLGTFEESLGRLADAVESLPGLADSAAALPALTEHAGALAELTEHAGALAELTRHAATLPELTQHAAALPELAPRVRSVELMVERIIGYLDTLQPTVNELTLAAADLHRAVGPIGRIAGRLPGSRLRQVEPPPVDAVPPRAGGG